MSQPKNSHLILRRFGVDGVASKTSKNDVIYECERYGKVVSCSLRKSYALVEFKHSDDAKYALKKLEGVRIDGSKWLVDPADVKDFKYFDWTPPSSVEPSPERSRSRSPSAHKDKASAGGQADASN